MTQITLRTSIVINRCYGGFRLSDKAALELAERKGLNLVRMDSFLVVDSGNMLVEWKGRMIEECFPRDDPDLVDLVRIYEDASGDCSQLEVKTVRVTVEIDNHDGMERIGTAYAEANL